MRWESRGGLWATDLILKKQFKTNAKSVARETDFYRVDDDEVDPEVIPPLLVETLLSKVEGLAIRVIDALIADGAESLDGPERVVAATYVATQIVRGRHHRAAMRCLATGVTRYTLGELDANQARERLGADLTDDEVGEYLRVHEEIKSGVITVVPTQSSAIGMALSVIDEIAKHLFGRWWVVYESQAPLVTSDEPVVLLGGKGVTRSMTPGVGPAGVVFFPLDPHHLLVMFDRNMPLDDEAFVPVLTPDEAREINLELYASAHRIVITDGAAKSAPSVPPLPPPVAEAIVESQVPVVNVQGAFTLHMFHPSRWLYVPDQPLPVARWWSLEERLGTGPPRATPWVPKEGIALNDAALARRRSRAVDAPKRHE